MSDDPSHDVIMVTGGAGFVGSQLVAHLAQAGRAVRAVDVVENDQSRELAARDGVEFRALDLRDRAAVDDALEGVTHLIHLAAVRSKSSDANPRLSHEVNVDATYDLFAGAARHVVRRVVFGSSHTVYGAFADPVPFPFRETESGGTGRGMSFYAATKLAAEAYLEAFAAAGSIQYLSLRFGTIYGPRVAEGSNNATMLDVLRAIDAGTAPVVPWSPDSRHGLVHVDDVVAACVRALDSAGANMAVNVVGEPVSSETIYTRLVSLYGGNPATIGWQASRQRFQAADRSRMRNVLGMADCVPLEEGLQSVIDWHRTRS